MKTKSMYTLNAQEIETAIAFYLASTYDNNITDEMVRLSLTGNERKRLKASIEVDQDIDLKEFI